jgi:regulator of sigma E protease
VSWLLAVGGFAVLIVLHELGHFVAAKAVGMRVEKFSLFFGPMLVRFQRGETTYGIGAIPLGGYVKISGMNPHEELPEEVAHRAYFRQPVWKRIVVIAAGPLVNVVLAFVIITGVLAIHGGDRVSRDVASLQKGYPAFGELKLGERIVSVDGRAIAPDDLPSAIAAHRCAGAQVKGCRAATPAVLELQGADGTTRTVSLRPVFDAAPRVQRTRLGFSLGFETVPVSLPRAAADSLTGMWDITTGTVSALGKVIYDSRARGEVSGVVGTTTVVSDTFKKDENVQAIQLLAFISLSLAIINLFPFLPLDGGHIFWAVAEKLRGRAISFRLMEQASVLGLVLVAMLFVLGLSNDIGRLTGEGFNVR